MKITGLKVKDYLILEDVEITPDSKLNIFAGKNKQGKTSFIKAIEAGLKGISDPSVIRRGADKSEIQIDIEGLKIRRTMNRKGNGTLKVVTPAGDIKASPQNYLDGLLSDFSFDPLTFIMLEGKERTKYLRELFKTKLLPEHLFGVIDPEIISKLDFEKDGLSILKELELLNYSKRTDINKHMAGKKALYESYPKVQQIDDYEDARPIIKERLLDAEKKLTEANAIKKQAEGTLAYVKKLEDKIVKDKAELALVEQQMQTVDYSVLLKEMDELKAQIEELSNQLKMKESLKGK